MDCYRDRQKVVSEKFEGFLQWGQAARLPASSSFTDSCFWHEGQTKKIMARDSKENSHPSNYPSRIFPVKNKQPVTDYSITRLLPKVKVALTMREVVAHLLALLQERFESGLIALNQSFAEAP